MGDFWVFGYGSLMWRPGFEYLETHRAHLYGYHRSLCVKSFVHRGTQTRPGLVLGLDRGGSCIGIAFRVAEEKREAVTAYLRERELVTNVYHEKPLRVTLDNGHGVDTLGYVVDRGHSQYAGRMGVDEAARHVAGAAGRSGPNEEYVINTLSHLHTLGIRDHWLEGVAARITGKHPI